MYLGNYSNIFSESALSFVHKCERKLRIMRYLKSTNSMKDQRVNSRQDTYKQIKYLFIFRFENLLYQIQHNIRSR